MTVYNVYGERRAQEVYWETWGHLAPIPHKKYTGWIVATTTAYRSTDIIDWQFEELPASPWQAEDFIEFVCDHIPDEVGVYIYRGWYKKFKNGNYQFQVSSWEKVDIPLLDY